MIKEDIRSAGGKRIIMGGNTWIFFVIIRTMCNIILKIYQL